MLCLEAAQTLRAICATNNGNSFVSLFGFELSGGVETYKTLAQAAIGTTVSTIYTVPSSTVALIKSITIGNTSSTAITGVQLFIGGTAQANALTGLFNIPGAGSVVYEDGEWTITDSFGRHRIRQN